MIEGEDSLIDIVDLRIPTCEIPTKEELHADLLPTFCILLLDVFDFPPSCSTGTSPAKVKHHS